MECKEFKEHISEFLDNELPEDKMKLMRQHLALCVACKKEYEELAEMKALLGNMKEVPLPAGFDERMKAALAPEFERARAASGVFAEERIVGNSVSAAAKKRRMKKMTAVAAVLVIGLFGVALAQNDDIIFKGFETAVSQEAVQEETSSADTVTESATDEIQADADGIESEYYDGSDGAAYSTDATSDAGSTALGSGNGESSSSASAYSKDDAVYASEAAPTPQVTEESANSEDNKSDGSDKALLESGAAASQAAVTGGAGDKNGGKHGHKGHRKPKNTPSEESLAAVSRGGDDFHKSGANSAADAEYYKGLIANELSGSSYEITGYSQTDKEKWIFVVSVQGEDTDYATSDAAANAVSNSEKSLIYKGENGRLTLVDED